MAPDRELRPYSRSEYNRALVLNALTQPFNVCLLASIAIAGLLLDLLLPLLAVGIVLYGIAVARTYFDEEEAEQVLERERARRSDALEAGRLDESELAEPIARLLQAGRHREMRIHDAIERAQLPYDEVSREVDRFIRAMEDGGRRAQLLYEALAEAPPAQVEQRLSELRGDPVPGSSFIDMLELFEADQQTELIVMCGEIGGSAEEEAADYIADNVSKPVLAYIAGFTAPPGKTMGHAGAIVSGSKGTAAAKAEALEAKGVRVGRNPTQVSEIAVEILGTRV